MYLVRRFPTTTGIGKVRGVRVFCWMMEIVDNFHEISVKRRLQISTDRRPMRSASMVIAAFLSSVDEELLLQYDPIASSCFSDNVVTMDTLLAFSVGNANSRVSGTRSSSERNLINLLIL
jgi:hypothetical protein